MYIINVYTLALIGQKKVTQKNYLDLTQTIFLGN